MSISSRIEQIEQHIEDDYSVLTLGGADLTNVDKNIFNLKPQWQDRLKYYLANGTDVVWNNWEKVNATNVETTSLSPTIKGKMKVDLKGNTQQNGTPTPNTPIPVQVVSGDNTIKVANGDNTEYEEYPISLGNIELCKIGTYQDKIAKSSGKNLFDKSSVTLNKYLDTTGTPTNDNTKCYSDYISINGITDLVINQYGNWGSVCTCYYDKNKQFILSETGTTIVANSNKFTIPNNAYYMRVSTNQSWLDTTQINIGQTALPYEPYGKVWYLNKQIGKVTFTGAESENWKSYSSGNILVNYIESSSYHKGSATDNPILSTHFIPNFANTNGSVYLGSASNRIVICADFVVDTSAWKTWLSSNNVICYYALSTPTYEEITDTTLLGQLNALENANSYNNTTNVSQSNDDMPFILDLTALKEMA